MKEHKLLEHILYIFFLEVREFATERSYDKLFHLSLTLKYFTEYIILGYRLIFELFY